MKSLLVWINGKFADIDKASVSIFDRGYLYGDGVFETMRGYAGVVFRLDAHMDRLFKALRVMRIPPPYSKDYLKGMIYRVLKTNSLKNAYVRIAVTRGEGRFGIGYKDKFAPNVVIVAKEFGEYPEWMHRKGISAKVSEIRQNEYSPASRIKSLNYLNCILARLYAKAEGCDEAILKNTKGHIAEAATSNIFLVKKRALITPSLDSGCLPGVTREAVLKIARTLGLEVREKRVSRKELSAASEVFLTNSLAEVLPVTRIDSRRIGDSVPGEITRLLHISYQKEVIREVLKAHSRIVN